MSLLPSVGCDKATPVAPNGTTLTISANPSKIGLNGRSTITIVGRKPDGNPLNPGTEIRLTTDKGTLSDSIVTTGDGGTATVIFRADGRSGTAKITALTGGGMTMATTDIQVGESADTKPSVLVSVSPNNLAVGETSRATVTVIARNSDGSPLAGQQVILTSTLGSLKPERPTTGADGTATATFTAGNQAGSAEVSAIVGSSDVARTTVTIRDAATDINLQANPSAVPASGGTITLTAFVTNSQGQPLQGAPVTFRSDRGTLETTGVTFTDTSGVATNRLTLAQADLPTAVNSFNVTASTPSGSGALLSDSVTVNVNR
jgi:adhesin/invasin